MLRIAAPVVLVCVALAASACTRVDDGTPESVADSPSAQTSSETLDPETSASETPASETSTPGLADPGPGIVPTPAVGTPCVPAEMPPVRVVAAIPDPAAPKATVGVPDGWTTAPGDGDPEGARLEGPERMEAVVTIAPTTLDAETAFRDWVDMLTEGATLSTVSTLPGELCGYSGQVLMGNLADDNQSVEYRDRLVYVGTAAQNYLIVVHAEAPAGTPGFVDAAAVITDDFEIGLP